MNKLFSIVVVLMFFSCANREKHLLLDVRDIDYRNKTDFVLEGKVTGIEAIGMEDIIFCDSFLLVATSDPDGMIKVFNPTSFEEVARLCKKGRARNEFISMSVLYNRQYVKDGKTMIPVVNNGYMLEELDFTSSMQQNSAVTTPAKWTTIDVFQKFFMQLDTAAASMAGDAPQIDPGSIALIDNDMNTVFYYNSWHAPSFSILDMKNMKKSDLDVYSGIMDIEHNGDLYYSIYSGATFKHPKRNLFIHVLRGLDYIYYFDLDNNKNFALHQKGTTTFEDKLTFAEFKEMRRAFTNGLCTDDFFVAIYMGGDYFAESPKESSTPELLLFDYEGNYLCGAKVKNHINSIAYDPRTKTLYGADCSEEKIYAYDFSEIVDYCHEKN